MLCDSDKRQDAKFEEVENELIDSVRDLAKLRDDLTLLKGQIDSIEGDLELAKSSSLLKGIGSPYPAKYIANKDGLMKYKSRSDLKDYGKKVSKLKSKRASAGGK